MDEKKSLNNDYDIQFLKIGPERGKNFQEIGKKDYRATLKLISTAPSVPIVEITQPSGVIFPKEFFPNQTTFPGDLWKIVNGYYTPSVEDAKKADEIVYKCITDKEKFIDEKTKLDNYTEDQQQSIRQQLNNIESRYLEYHRQYVG